MYTDLRNPLFGGYRPLRPRPPCGDVEDVPDLPLPYFFPCSAYLGETARPGVDLCTENQRKGEREGRRVCGHPGDQVGDADRR